MRRVIILQPAVPSYRLEFFESLIQHGLESDIRYEILSPTKYDVTKKNAQTRFMEHFLNANRIEINFKSRSLFVHLPSRSFAKADLIIAEFAIHNLITFWWAFLAKHRKIALWGHGKTYTKKNTPLEEWLKGRLAKQCDWFFSYTKGGVDALASFGYPISQITTVQNSTDTYNLVNIIETITDSDIESFKERYLIQTENLAIFIGSLESSKRLEFLIDSAKLIYETIPDFKVLIFGTGPEKAKIEARCNEEPFLHFCGVANVKDKAIASQVCKFIMMPGRVGLIAVDSFAMGLPIITTNWKWHAPEFEYLVHNSNALIADDNLSSYVLCIKKYLSDARLRDRIAVRAKSDLKEFGINRMADNFHMGVLSFFSYAKKNGDSN